MPREIDITKTRWSDTVMPFRCWGILNKKEEET